MHEAGPSYGDVAAMTMAELAECHAALDYLDETRRLHEQRAKVARGR